MGIVEIEGLGRVQIAGDRPTKQEAEYLVGEIDRRLMGEARGKRIREMAMGQAPPTPEVKPGAVVTQGIPGAAVVREDTPSRVGFYEAAKTAATGGAEDTAERRAPIYDLAADQTRDKSLWTRDAYDPGAFADWTADEMMREKAKQAAAEEESSGETWARDFSEMLGEDILGKYGAAQPLTMGEEGMEVAERDIPLMGSLIPYYMSFAESPLDYIRYNPIEGMLELAPPVIHILRSLKGRDKAKMANKLVEGHDALADDAVKATSVAKGPVVAEVAEAVAPGEGGAVLTEGLFEQVMTGKKKDLDAVMEGMGMEGGLLPIPVTKSQADALRIANQTGVADRAKAIVESLNESPRPLSDVEGAGLLVYGRRLQDAHKSLASQMDEAVKAGNLDEANRMIDAMEAQEKDFFDLMSAYARSASERGRALQAQKMVLGKDYSLISMKTRAVAARKAGLTAKEAERYGEMAKGIEDAMKAEAEAIDAVAKRLGKSVDELELDANGFPLEATDAELSKIMGFRMTGQELRSAADLDVLKAKDKKAYAIALIGDAMSTPKLFKASADLSAPGRQGIFSLLGTKGWANSKLVSRDLAGAAKFGEEGARYAYKAQREIVNGDIAGLAGDALKAERVKAVAARQAGLSYTSAGGRLDPLNAGGLDRLTKAEEAYAGNIFGARRLRRIAKGTEKGAGAKVTKKLEQFSGYSERTFSLPLNRLRKEKFLELSGLADLKTAEDIAKRIQALGPKNMKIIADFVNSSTGRGRLGGLENAKTWYRLVNAVMFSPKFVMSRLQTLFEPVRSAGRVVGALRAKDNISIEVEKAIMGQYASAAAKLGLAGAMASTAFSAADANASISLDPASSEFMKLRVGDSRYDVTGGLGGMVRNLYSLNPVDTEGFGQGVWQEAGRIARQKASPVAGLAADVYKGRDWTGEEVDVTDPSFVGHAALGLAAPISAEDLYENVEKYGVLEGSLRTAPAVFGIGQSDYDKRGNIKLPKGSNFFRLKKAKF